MDEAGKLNYPIIQICPLDFTENFKKVIFCEKGVCKFLIDSSLLKECFAHSMF